MLYADCEEIGVEPLEVRSPVSLDGTISIAKMRDASTETVPVRNNGCNDSCTYFGMMPKKN